MNDAKYKMEFRSLCRYSALGELVNQPKSISGGLLHRMYSVETTTGKYAVKLLNPNIMIRQAAMQNYINSEKISSFVSKRIPALPAEKKNGNIVQQVNGQFYLVFKWRNEISLAQEKIDVNHCKIIGKILADIHQTDFSKLEIIEEKSENVTLTDWDYYFQKGKEEDAEWAEILLENLDNLERWSSSAAMASDYLSSNRVISHRDLDPKNVLWNHYNPVLIDWESAGFINPMQDLIETTIYWSVNQNGEINQQRFFSFIEGYKEKCGELHADWKMVLATGFSGKLGWLEYSLKRSLWIECTDEEEQKMGTTQVIETMHEIRNYAEQIPNLLQWLTNKY
ncbi:TPA_asm: phosphotransferase [Listeria monocytogenes]|uniref:Aminoglycoside phosphotransferase family protein n=1 Tax=Listeria monocytogenes TaxID=1639 RepID=A0A6Z0WN13_LISMN|nr:MULTISPECIES: phosphotransferase [Listeria]EAD3615109.1 aminoglycoside phosphotransferase family protein [Listeria monocytogenes]EAD3642477.1 aminoglycoside phosphotransferase family protein [Listeria monocytogenes]EAD5499316.1 aminoglycoside phosphotransferase family protein [Listeria monocytogenes]EAD5500085.1 aminoglycoside phosphotransferase family protein [Listeria monocytogenes]EAD6208954.1 aminoglycoside phosphotransferase family protein [Listeria monocytogenes]